MATHLLSGNDESVLRSAQCTNWSTSWWALATGQ
jgi:hypothetical protein